MKNKSCTVLFIFIFFHFFVYGQEFKEYFDAGITGQLYNRSKPYLTPGDRTYIVGTQDGNFPDLGWHVKGEMGGIWMPPIKLLDGFWVKLTDEASDKEAWLIQANEFINYPYGNKFVYDSVLNGIQVERFQYCPQGKGGIVIMYTIKNSTKKLRNLRMDFVVKTDISPVWFSTKNNIIDSGDSILWDGTHSVFTARDNRNSWFAVWGIPLPVISHSINVNTPIKTIGMGKSSATTYDIEIRPNGSAKFVFVVGGSNQNKDSAMKNYEDILQGYDKMLIDKKLYYTSIFNRAKIEIPDKKLQEAYTWGKFNTEWLVSDLPSIGRFLGAGAVEYPWLFGCDNDYASQGVVASGDLELAKSTLRVLKNVSEKVNGNGRIIHEMSSNGFVANKGNTEETAQFAIAVWKVFQWTGDVSFLKEMYPYIKQGINWLLTIKDKNKNMFPEGYGIMEIPGLNAELIDVAVYTQQALEVASKMAIIFNEPEIHKKYAQKAAILKNKINTLFWDESQGSYCDFFGTRDQAICTVKRAIKQIQHVKYAEGDSIKRRKYIEFNEELLKKLTFLPDKTLRGWITNKIWVINTPLETGLVPPNRAVRFLDKIRKENTGEYGPYLSAVERKYMMTIATGVQAVAECVYGRTDQALWYVDKIVETFSKALPGSISEMMPGYGCPVQAWTIYGLVKPLVCHIFGINPDAYHKVITFAPNLPSGWNNITISNLPVGNNEITFGIKKNKGNISYTLTSKDSEWKYILKLKDLRGKKCIVNGTIFTANSDEIELFGKVNNILISMNN